MTKKITDPKMSMFMKFFESQGVKFVDVDTGEEVVASDEEDE